MATTSFRLRYRHCYFWLIFWIILFFPVALVLLGTGSSIEVKNKCYLVAYNGSRFWLAFWTIVFFPIMFLLIFLNGFSIQIKPLSSEQCGCCCDELP